MSRPAYNKRNEKGGRTVAPPDLDEDAAMERAVAAMRATSGDAYAQAYACISAWVLERARIQAVRRIPENLVFDMGDARLRGVVEAALPKIGEAISDIDPDKPLFSLEKNQVIDVFVVGVSIVMEVALRLKETDDWPFSDAIPF